MFYCHHGDDIHTCYLQHAIDRISQEKGVGGADRCDEGVRQRGESFEVSIVDGDGVFVDADDGVGGVGGVVGRRCDVRSGGDDVGECGVGVGGAVELVEVPLGVCEQRGQQASFSVHFSAVFDSEGLDGPHPLRKIDTGVEFESWGDGSVGDRHAYRDIVAHKRPHIA